MSTLNDTDLFVIERSGTNYQVRSDEMSTLQDTDLFVVERSGTNYQIEAKDVNTGGGGGDLTQVNLAPLSGTPDFEVTATTDLSEILPESVIHYQWYRYTASTGGTGTSVKSFNSDSAIFDTYTTEAADQGNYIGCTVTYLGTTVTETERTQCLTAPGPVATMYGLRFDNNRLTYLETTLSVDTANWSFSAWIKLTDYFDARYITSFGSGSENAIRTNASGQVNVISGDGSIVQGSSTTIPLNTWTHLVVSNSPNGVVVSINGVSENLGTASFPQIESGSALVRLSQPSSPYGIDGYLSEVYFVEQALPPEVFGKNFEPYGWGPLDSSQIEEYIGEAVIQPYDTRANTDEVWSSQVTPTDANTATVFNGDVSTGTVNTAFDWTTSIPNVETLEIFTQASSLNPSTYSTLTVNGVDVSANLIDGNGYNTISNPPSTLTNITATYNGTGNKIDIYSIKVNGRILVDSTVWNNSQNWSDNYASATGFEASGPAVNAFDGSTSTSANPANDGSSTFTIPAGIASASFSAVGVGGTSAKINSGSEVSIGNGVGGSLAAVGTVSSGDVVTFARSSGTASVYAMSLDGAILVDSGAQWNTSQLWSTGAPTPLTGTAANVFDGNLTTQAVYSASTTATTFNAAISGVTKVEFFMNSDATSRFIGINGNLNTEIVNAGSQMWQTAYEGSAVDMTSFGMLCSGANYGLYGVRVNGEILVDQGSFGANGFYLPFDPEATGVDYSSSIEVEQAGYTFGDPQYCFNGNLNEFGYTPDNGQSATFPSVAAIPTGLLEVYGMSQSQTCSVMFDDVQVAVMPDNYGGWTTVGNLDNVEKLSISSSGQIVVAGFRVNGKILLDHNSIGVDDSGNKNNFYNQNFGVGNTSQVWSNSTTRPNTNIPTAYTPINMFDGSLSTDCRQDPESSPILFEPTGLSYASSLRVHVTSVNNANQVITVVTSAGTESKIGNTFGPTGTGVWVEFTANPGTIISVSQVTDIGIVNAIQAVEVDGEILVDPSSLDTVTDTPLMAYAVLSQGSNGNLINTSSREPATYFGEVGQTYYFEVDGVGATTAGGSSFTSQIGSTYNFGQQPFVASNVIYDQATGTVEIPGTPSPYDERANTSQVWSNGTLTGATTPLQYLYDGNSSTFVNNNASNPPTQIVVTLPVQVPVNTSLRFYGNVESAAPPAYLIEATYSDDTTERLVTSNTGFAWYEITGAAGKTLKSFNWTGSTAGQGATNNYWSQVEIDGRLLVDQGVWDNSQNWSNTNPGPTPASFDGDFTTYAAIPANTTYYFPTPISFTNKVEVAFVNSTAGWQAGVLFQGDSSVTLVDSPGDTSFVTLGTGSGTILGWQTAIIGNSYNVGVAAFRIDGALLVDSGAQWNTSQVWSAYGTGNTGSGGEWANAFDGSLSSISFPASGTLTWTPSSGIPFTTLQIAGYKDTSPGTLKINGVDVTSQLSNSPISTVTITGVTSPLTSIESTSNGPTANIGLAAVIVDDEFLVDPTGGTYNTLFQTWEQTQAALLKTAAELGYDYAEVLLAIARPWTLGEVYNTNDLIKYNCRVYRALQDSITSYLPTSTNTAYWEDINLECDPTAHPGLMDLIPDDWTDEQRQAALQELLAELNAQTTPN